MCSSASTSCSMSQLQIPTQSCQCSKVALESGGYKYEYYEPLSSSVSSSHNCNHHPQQYMYDTLCMKYCLFSFPEAPRSDSTITTLTADNTALTTDNTTSRRSSKIAAATKRSKQHQSKQRQPEKASKVAVPSSRRYPS
mmetsp:Transcript_46424/g.77159  ORF Transcript_46424/g.77159 Transcript_46424/m.77159 type:complete len:139 (-) Transcript_46424:949-1365(-)